MSGPRGFAYRSNGEMMSQGSVKDFNYFEYSGPTDGLMTAFLRLKPEPISVKNG